MELRSRLQDLLLCVEPVVQGMSTVIPATGKTLVRPLTDPVGNSFALDQYRNFVRICDVKYAHFEFRQQFVLFCCRFGFRGQGISRLRTTLS